MRRAKNAIGRLRAGRKPACELTGTECVRDLQTARLFIVRDPWRKGPSAPDSKVCYVCFSEVCGHWGSRELPRFATARGDTVTRGETAGHADFQGQRQRIFPAWRLAKQRFPALQGMLPAVAPLTCRNCRTPGLGGMNLTLEKIAISLIRWQNVYQGIA